MPAHTVPVASGKWVCLSIALAALAAVTAACPARAAGADAPVNTSAPAISGTLRVGQVLTALSGWSGTGEIDFTYQWQRCDASGANCAGIGGATSQSYLLVSADAGATIRVSVTATNSSGTATAVSAVTTVVLQPPAAPSARVAPSVTGPAVVGAALTAGAGSWNGDTPIAYAYQWQRCTLAGSCSDIAGARGASYTPSAVDSGKQVRVEVTATNNVSSDSALSNLSDIVTGGPNAPVNTSLPAVAGAPLVGQTLSVSTGVWTGAPPFTFVYQWQRCSSRGTGCVNIAGATDRSYTVVAGDTGRTLGATVIALIAAGAGIVRSSLSGIVSGGQTAPVSTGLPALTGVAEVGQTMRSSTGTWAGPAPTAFSYQWQRCTGPGSCSDIAAATGSSYVLGPADRGVAVRVVVTALNANGSTAASSSRSAVVAAAGSLGAIVLGNGLTSVPVSSLVPPDRLVVDDVQRSGTVSSFTLSLRVRDLHGRVVRGALVQVLAIPLGTIAAMPERASDRDGRVTFRLRPRPHAGGTLYLLVRTRKPGDDPRAGISNRQLVQVRLTGR